MGKPELILQHLDEWMVRWRHFQTEDDWKIEKAAQNRRQWNYGITGIVAGSCFLYTAAPASINRYFGAPHFFDIGADVMIKDFLRNTINGRRRWTPYGYARIAFNVTVPFLVLATLEHRSETKRLADYKQVETAFGEQCRRLLKNGHIEEFLCYNIGASVNDVEKVVMAPA